MLLIQNSLVPGFRVSKNAKNNKELKGPDGLIPGNFNCLICLVSL